MPRTIAIVSQVYPPDPTAVGQYMHDVAVELTRRGWHVVVYTSDSGYEDPTQKYQRRETIDGVDVRRLLFSGFGKASIPIRVLGGFLFTLQAAARALFLPKLQVMLVSTSPPMGGLAGALVGLVRRIHVAFWAMDLNPDQMVALGNISASSPFVRGFDWLNRRILKRSRVVIALDRFMADRINRKVDCSAKMLVIPPWPLETHVQPVPHEENPFRAEHGLQDKTVVMYSGNLSIASPVTTILEAAKRLEQRSELVFLFVGGGLGKKEIDEIIARDHPPNIRTLPYQPIERLRYSLSAADVHLVAVGNAVVGICHPCKIYGAMAAARPILCLGPRPSHATDIVDGQQIGWTVEHGDVDRAEQLFLDLLAMDKDERQEMGRRARSIVEQRYAMKILCGQFCDAVEHGVRAESLAPSASAVAEASRAGRPPDSSGRRD